MLGKAARSSLRDRTHEFRSIAEGLKKSVSSGPGPNGPSRTGSKAEEQRPGVALQSEFNRRASKIRFGIHQTSQRLAMLAKLAKRTSLFDDPSMEIEVLSEVVHQDIAALESALVDLGLLCDSLSEGGVSSDTTRHSNAVVAALIRQLISAAKWFMAVLTLRFEKLEVLENRRRLFSSAASKGTANPFVCQRPLAARTAAHASAAPPPPWANGSPSSSSSSSSSPLFPWSMTVFEYLQQWGGMAVDRFRTLCERRR